MPESVKVSANITLELIGPFHAKPLLDLLNANREHLAEWLPWVAAMQTVDDFSRYIGHCERQHKEGTDYGYVIRFNHALAGRAGFHYINQPNQSAAIGYWLGKEFEGRGIVTKACTALINYGFATLGLNRIEIKCGTGNQKSSAIAERLQFTKRRDLTPGGTGERKIY